MLIHAKAYDAWTRRLVTVVKARGAALAVRVEGPYPETPGWFSERGDEALVMVAGERPGWAGFGCLSRSGAFVFARDLNLIPFLQPPTFREYEGSHPTPNQPQPQGGIGIAAALSVLEELPVNSAGQTSRPLLLIWTARHPAELLVLAPRLFAAAKAKGVAMTTHLYYTGGSTLLVNNAASRPSSVSF